MARVSTDSSALRLWKADPTTGVLVLNMQQVYPENRTWQVCNVADLQRGISATALNLPLQYGRGVGNAHCHWAGQKRFRAQMSQVKEVVGKLEETNCVKPGKNML